MASLNQVSIELKVTGEREVQRAYQNLQKAQDSLNRGIVASVDANNKNAKSLDRIAREVSKAQREMDRLAKALNQGVIESRQFHGEANKIAARLKSLGMDKAQSEVTRYKNALLKANAASRVLSDATLKTKSDNAQLEAQVRSTTNAINAQSGAQLLYGRNASKAGVLVQQSGYQIGDFIVQIQSGTNAFVAFGQQATQVAGTLTLLGGKWIGIGTVLGIAIPLLTAIGAAFMRTRQEADDTDKSLQNLVASINAAASSAEKSLRPVSDLREEYGRFAEAVQRASQLRAQAELSNAMSMLENASAQARIGLDAFNQTMIEYGNRLNQLDTVTSSLGETTVRNAASFEQAEEAVDKARQASVEAAKALGLSVGEAAKLDEALKSLASAKGMDGIAEAAQRSLDTIRGMFGASENIPPEIAKIVIEMEKVLAAASAGATAFDNLENRASNVADELGRAAGNAWGIFDGLSAAVQVRSVERGVREGAIPPQALADMPTSAVEARRQAEIVERLERERRESMRKTGAAGARAGKEIEKGLTDAQRAANELSQAFESNLTNGIGSIASAFGDFVVSGLSNFEDFKDSIVSGFKRMISQMIAIAARNQIMIGLGLGGSVAGTAAAAATGGIGGGGGLLGGLLGNVVGGGGFLQGVGTGLGGVLSGGGLGSSFANLGGLISGSVGGSGAIGAALPAVGVIIGAAALLKKGLSREYAGTAVRGTLGTEGFEGTQFDFFKGGFLRSNQANYSEVSAEIQALLSTGIGSMITGLESMADTLSLSTDAIKTFTDEQFTVWTNGKTQEQVQQELAEQIQQTTERMADLVLTTDEFSRAGETSLDTLNRLGSNLQAVNTAMDTLGHTMYEASLSGGDMASALVDAFGGLDAFNSAVTTYFESFYSESERTSILTRQLREAFRDLNVAMPRSRDQFREMVESIDTTTEAGRKLYAEMLKLAGALSQVLPDTSPFTRKMENLVNKMSETTRDMLTEARQNAQESRQAAQQWARTSDSLRDFVRGLLGTELSAASPAQALGAARGRFSEAFTAARGGDLEAAQSIPGLARTLLQLEREGATTDLEFRRIAGQIQGQINFLGGISELESGQETVLAGLYEKQIDVLEDLEAYLQSDGITRRGLRNFKKSLDNLDASIVKVKDFSYGKLVEDIEANLKLAGKGPKWLRKLVEASNDTLTTTLNMVIGRDDLTPEQKFIAASAVSEHTSSLKFLLEESTDIKKAQMQKFLDEGTTYSRDAVLKMLLSKNSDLSKRQINKLLNEDAVYNRRTMMRLLLASSDDLTKRQANKILGEQQTFSNNAAMRIILNETNDLTKPQMKKLLKEDSTYKKDAIMKLLLADSKDLTKKQMKDFLGTTQTLSHYLKFGLTGDKNVPRVVKDLNEILKAQGGKLDFSGSVGITTDIKDPMDKLRNQLGKLREAITDDLNYRKVADLQIKGAGAKSELETARGERKAANTRINQIIAEAGVTRNAQGYLVGTTGQFDQVMNQLRTIFGVSGNTIAGLIDSIRSPLSQTITKEREDVINLRNQVRELGGVPAFALGGFHAGGARIVGEQGPELEVTGPSRIFNANDTRSMFNTKELTVLLRRLVSEMSGLRQDNNSGNASIYREVRANRRINKKWDTIGLPATQT